MILHPASTITQYRGRFAPTPSGPLHLGSLLTALASWLQARSQNGIWLLRIDDLDAARCPPQADAAILAQLDAHGLHWDATPLYQSSRQDQYRCALDELDGSAQLYACDCTRKALKLRLRAGPDDLVYDGFCRTRGLPRRDATLRIRLHEGRVAFSDPWCGDQSRDLSPDMGDFVVARNDGIIGYQLASVVDDRDMRITEVVRGADLIGSSLRQQYLFEHLQLPAPNFRHLPLLVSADRRKLSKQNHAAALDLHHAVDNLWRCLNWLGQTPPQALQTATVPELLAWAIAHWNEKHVPRMPINALVTEA